MTHVNWTKAEATYLIRNYGQKGGAWCAEKLGRSVNSINGKARRLRLLTACATPLGFVSIATLAHKTGLHKASITRVARRQHVLHRRKDPRPGKRALVLMVPDWWAKKYREAHTLDPDGTIANTYVSVRTIAQQLGVSVSTINRGLRGYGVTAALGTARSVRIRRTTFVNPHDVEVVAKAIRDSHDPTLITLKEIHFNTNIPMSTLRYRIRRLGIPLTHTLRGTQDMTVIPSKALNLLTHFPDSR